MANELLIEIGTEDIPAKYFPEVLENLKSVAEETLTAERLKFKGTSALGTMRRMVLIISGLEEKQEDLIEEVIGPKAENAFDDKGSPSKAVAGFARAHGVDVSDLFIKETKRGKSICARRTSSGKGTSETLPEILPVIIGKLTFPKSMRWGNLDFKFVRPIHWIAALYAGKVIKFKIGDIESSDSSFGHRFLSPSSFEIKNFEDYSRKCRDNFVSVDPSERKAVIEKKINDEANSKNGCVLNYEDLLDIVNFMAEYPTAFTGSFPESYLALPEEILINTMKKQQMYFPVFDSNKKLMNCFIGISDTDSKEMKLIIKGNERVIKARLADAEFFFTEDQKITLEKRVESLKGIIFMEKLGTMHDKTMRLGKLAVFLSKIISVDSNKGKLKINQKSLKKSALLCKTDLVTEIVKEFPQMQGIIGREYAMLQGEGEETSLAIYEHYLPRFAEDKIPQSDNGAILSLADKIDTISGCFSVSIIPTGSEDPLGLRRSAIGIINTVLNKGYRVSLKKAIRESLNLYGKEKNQQEILSQITDFLTARFKNILISQNYEADVIDSVVSQGLDDILDSKKRIEDISRMKKEAGFDSLAITFKRAVKILPNIQKGDVKESLLKETAEKDLYRAYNEVEISSGSFLARGDYYSALQEISRIRPDVDRFFDDVMVNVDNLELKNNRLNLLNNVVKLFSRITDFGKISE